MDLSIVVPIFNEAKNIPLLYEKVHESFIDSKLTYELIFINDGSKDNSAQILDQIAKKHTNIIVVHFRRNYGQTAAMMAGFDLAQGEIVVPLDGDLQNDPKDILRLVEKLNEGFDVCSGWRKNRKDHKLRRNLPSRIANSLISKISGVQLHDYGCSLKAYRKDVLKGVRLYGEMHRFIPIYASWQGAKVTEIVVDHHPRLHGNSNYGLERTLKVLLDLIVVKFFAKYAQKPIYVFGGLGVLSYIGAFLFAAWALFLKFNDKLSLHKTPLPLLTIFMVLTGTIFITMGLLAEFIMRTYYESQNKTVYQIAKITANASPKSVFQPNTTSIAAEF